MLPAFIVKIIVKLPRPLGLQVSRSPNNPRTRAERESTNQTAISVYIFPVLLGPFLLTEHRKIKNSFFRTVWVCAVSLNNKTFFPSFSLCFDDKKQTEKI